MGAFPLAHREPYASTHANPNRSPDDEKHATQSPFLSLIIYSLAERWLFGDASVSPAESRTIILIPD